MSKDKLLLIGAGGFDRMAAEQAMFHYDCAFVDDGQPVGAEICGIPVVGGMADLSELRKIYNLLVVGIGNRFRLRVLCMRENQIMGNNLELMVSVGKSASI